MKMEEIDEEILQLEGRLMELKKMKQRRRFEVVLRVCDWSDVVAEQTCDLPLLTMEDLQSLPREGHIPSQTADLIVNKMLKEVPFSIMVLHLLAQLREKER